VYFILFIGTSAIGVVLVLLITYLGKQELPRMSQTSLMRIPRNVLFLRLIVLVVLFLTLSTLFTSFAPINTLPKASASKKVAIATQPPQPVPTIVHLPASLFVQGVKIMPLGDSITAGDNSYKYGAYRTELWQLCQAAGWHVQFVGSKQSGPPSLPDRHHEGHSGWRIDQISAHVVPWLETYQPQIILLHIGTNDLRQSYSVNTALERLSYLIDQITTTLPAAMLIVAQVTPQWAPSVNTNIIAYDNAIPALVKQKMAMGKRVECVDMYNAVPVSDVSDDIHPNTQGYALMAHVWFQALVAMTAQHQSVEV
jgi:lysophospholipase L1-like esterase